ncbi:hypothetical protein N7468_009188 [Penicillium chermesinum]|uniref:Uncharacterized protein n=1 Tax=Penicillium chermesinum TaxID=63820 RepID=A0A9W9NJT1_9EURO|nr:uncharacterized protein N7468_009188 [Penicillium chermesinum]KAJ5219984.1 hypothetical protein N7468_009188 [Penicillium chermesinum]
MAPTHSPLITHPRTPHLKIRKKAATTDDYGRLQYNPWAQALASDTRACVLTGARMPRSLMGKWGMVRKPDTDKLYMLPVELLMDSLGWRPSKNTKKARRNQDANKEAATSEENVSDLQSDSALDRRRFFDQPMTLYMAYLKNPIRRLSEKVELSANAKKSPIARLLSFRWRSPHGPFTPRDVERLTWSKDMPSLLARQMGSDIVKKLTSAVQRLGTTEPTADIWRAVNMQHYSDAALSSALECLEPVQQMECGVVLVLDGPKSSDAEPLADLTMLPQVRKRVPVFDLAQLLSESDLASLRQADPWFQKPALFYKPNTASGVDLVISLWKFQRYIAG